MIKLLLTNETTLKEALELLDKSGLGIIPVVNFSNKLLGIITDGDVRKAIIKNNFNLNNIINRNPYKLNINLPKKKVIAYLKKMKLRHIPLVDCENNLIDLFTFDDEEFNSKLNWVVIMAGGLGKRLGSLTRDTPKPMLLVQNKPILEHIIEQFVKYGFTKFILCVNFKAEVIEEYFGDGSAFDIEIIYVKEKDRLGTGGALSLIDIEMDEPFFVINGDVIATVDYDKLLDYHNQNKSEATMCIRKNIYSIPYGVIDVDDKNNIINLKEKPKYNFFINTGIYLLNPSVLGYIPKNEFFDLPNLFSIMKKKKLSIKSFEIVENWIDMGNPEDYEKLKATIAYDK